MKTRIIIILAFITLSENTCERQSLSAFNLNELDASLIQRITQLHGFSDRSRICEVIWQ
jgi:hypothetical protein